MAGSRSALIGLVVAALGWTSAPAEAREARVTAQFTIAVAGLTIGRGAFEAQLGAEGYAIAVSARLSGLAALVAPGEGQANARGTLNADRPVPASYAIVNTAGDWRNSIDITFRGSAVGDLFVDPPTPPHPDRIALTPEHRRGVIDPISALIMPVPGSGAIARPEACNRTLRIFDGRQRYDIVLSHKASPNERGRGDIEGPVLVCAARYVPIAGHRTDLAGPRRLAEATDNEAWLAPIPGTRALIVYRMIVSTPAGRMTIEARRIALQPGEN